MIKKAIHESNSDTSILIKIDIDWSNVKQNASIPWPHISSFCGTPEWHSVLKGALISTRVPSSKSKTDIILFVSRRFKEGNIQGYLHLPREQSATELHSAKPESNRTHSVLPLLLSHLTHNHTDKLPCSCRILLQYLSFCQLADIKNWSMFVLANLSHQYSVVFCNISCLIYHKIVQVL